MTAHELLRNAASNVRSVHAKLLAKLLGPRHRRRVLSRFLPARLLPRVAFDDLATRRSWAGEVRLRKTALSDVRVLLLRREVTAHLVGLPLQTSKTPPHPKPEASVCKVRVTAANAQMARPFAGELYENADHCAFHITAKEALAMLRSVQAVGESLRGHVLAVNIDASAVEFAVRNGVIRSATMMPIVRDIWTAFAFRGRGEQVHHVEAPCGGLMPRTSPGSTSNPTCPRTWKARPAGCLSTAPGG